MQRTYEIMFIVRPDILDEDLDKLIAGLEANITRRRQHQVDGKLGRRKLPTWSRSSTTATMCC